jgi:ribosomal protein S18 acetylase RimI-like enzyme
MKLTIQRGLPEPLREAAASIYWEAFGAKLGRVLGPKASAELFLARVIRADQCFVALDEDGALLGLAGFKTAEGSFAGGSLADMRACYGQIGALWRSLALWALGGDIDNQRFLLDGICVAEPAQGLGVGKALLAEIYDEAGLRGYDAVRLEVVDTNARARALYEREGFVATRTQVLGPLRYLFGFRSATTMVRPVTSAAS